MDNVKFMEEFYRYVPEMRDVVEERFRACYIEMSDGEFVVWGIGVMECIMELLRHASEHEKTLDRVFSFMEYMVLQRDEIKGLLTASFDCILNEEHLVPKALSKMGPETRKFWDEYMEYLRQFRLWKLSQL